MENTASTTFIETMFKTLPSGNLKELADHLGNLMIKALGINIASQLAPYSFGR